MVYAKGKSVFELIDPDGHIYVLQAHDAQFPIESLAKLGETTAQGLAIPHASPDRRPGAGPRTRQNYAVGDEFHQYRGCSANRRLADALQRTIHAPQQAQRKPFLPDDRIFLRNGKRARVVYVSQISGIKAEENYTDVLIADGSTVFMRCSISEWEELLPKPPFFTPHRSLIVNLQAVADLVLESRAEVHFKLEGHPHPFRLGQRPAARLRRPLRLSCGL